MSFEPVSLITFNEGNNNRSSFRHYLFFMPDAESDAQIVLSSHCFLVIE